MKVFVFVSPCFCKYRWSPTISAKSSAMLTGSRRSVTSSNSSNSAVGEFPLQKHRRHTTRRPPTLYDVSDFIYFYRIPVNSQPLSKAWKWGTPTLRPSLTSSPPTHMSWSSCRTPPFVSSGDLTFLRIEFRNQIGIIKIQVSCFFFFSASAATLINIRNARKHFEKLERVDGPKHSLHMRMR